MSSNPDIVARRGVLRKGLSSLSGYKDVLGDSEEALHTIVEYLISFDPHGNGSGTDDMKIYLNELFGFNTQNPAKIVDILEQYKSLGKQKPPVQPSANKPHTSFATNNLNVGKNKQPPSASAGAAPSPAAAAIMAKEVKFNEKPTQQSVAKKDTGHIHPKTSIPDQKVSTNNHTPNNTANNSKPQTEKSLNNSTKSPKSAGDFSSIPVKPLPKKAPPVSMKPVSNHPPIKLPSKLNVCRCFATKHDFLTSCQHCGKIFCVENEFMPVVVSDSPESADFCVDINTNIVVDRNVYSRGLYAGYCTNCQELLMLPFSHEIVSEIQSSQDMSYAVVDPYLYSPDAISAHKHKDKLLTFDKENAKRTHVHDAQGDYYSRSKWLSEQEKKDLDEKEKKRIEKRKASNRVVRMVLDVNTRQFVAAEGDEEEDGSESLQDSMGDLQVQDRKEFINPLVPPSNLDNINGSQGGGDLHYRNSVNHLNDESSKLGVIYRKLIEKWTSSEGGEDATSSSNEAGGAKGKNEASAVSDHNKAKKDVKKAPIHRLQHQFDEHFEDIGMDDEIP